MVTRVLRDCFDLNFSMYCILYITLCYKNYVTNMENREEIQLRPCSHGYDIVQFHFGSFQKVVRRGVAFTRVRKKIKRSVPKHSRNWAVWKSEPESGTIRYRTVPFSCEQKRYDIVPLSGPVLYLWVTPNWFL